MIVTRIDEGDEFAMGRGYSIKVISPDKGMNEITLNYSHFQPDDEFPQHIHDYSEDCFFVLDGGTSLRQGDAYTPINKYDFVWMPIREVHGTKNITSGEAELFSFQCPPDLALYTGERDKDDASTPKPSGTLRGIVSNLQTGEPGPDSPGSSVTQGGITPIVGPAMGAVRQLIDTVRLEPGGALHVTADSHEHVFVVLEGGGRIDGGPAPTGGRDLVARSVVYGSLDADHTVVGGDAGMLLLHARAQIS